MTPTLHGLILSKQWDQVTERLTERANQRANPRPKAAAAKADGAKVIDFWEGDDAWDADTSDDVDDDSDDEEDEARLVDGIGYLPLHKLCFQQPPLSVLQALWEAYPDAVSVPGAPRTQNGGQLPLHIAAFSGGPMHVVEFLLEKYPQGAQEREASDRGFLPLHSASAGATDPDVVAALLKAYPDASRVREEVQGRLPIHIIVTSSSDSREPCFKSILKAYPEAARKADHSGNLPLHAACRLTPCPSLEVVETLVRVYPKAASQPNEMGLLPLHVLCLFAGAMRADIVPVTRNLISAYQQSLVTSDLLGRIPLHLAWRDHPNSASFVKELIMACPNALYVPMVSEEHSARNEPWRCIMHEIPTSQHLYEDLESFVRKIYPAPTTTSPSTWLPLHRACLFGADTCIVDVLCRLHPSAVAEEDSEGRLPLHCACISPCSEKTAMKLKKMPLFRTVSGIKMVTNPDEEGEHHERRQSMNIGMKQRPSRPLVPSVISLLLANNGAALRVPDKTTGMVPFFLACWTVAGAIGKSCRVESKEDSETVGTEKQMPPCDTDAQSNTEALYILLRSSPDVLLLPSNTPTQ